MGFAIFIDLALALSAVVLLSGVYVLDHFKAERWLMRKYVHSTVVSIFPVYLRIVPSMEDTVLAIVFFLIFAGLLTAHPRIKFLFYLVERGTREGEDVRLLWVNSLSSTAILLSVFLIFFDEPHVFGAVTYAFAWGDGLGEVIGRPFGRHKYKILSSKSIEGSLAVLFGSFVGIVSGLALFGEFGSDLLLGIFALAMLVTIIEACSVSFVDNILIPISVVVILPLFVL